MPRAFEDIPRDVPALRQAQLISEQAVAAGFEWESVGQVWDKVREEVGEFESAEPGSANQAEELGDVLFSLVNVARKEGIDAEDALLRTCDKFRSRWSVMERLAAQEDAMSLQDARRRNSSDSGNGRRPFWRLPIPSSNRVCMDAKTDKKPQGAKKRKPSRRAGAPKAKKERRKRSWRVPAIVACIVLLAVIILYPVGRDYYQTMRTQQRLQAQLDAVTERNEAVQAENDALQTEEGVENQARSDLGWVREGESSAVVTNEQGTVDNTSRLPEHLDEKSITAPQTWYYTILDTIFFVHE